VHPVLRPTCCSGLAGVFFFIHPQDAHFAAPAVHNFRPYLKKVFRHSLPVKDSRKRVFLDPFTSKGSPKKSLRVLFTGKGLLKKSFLDLFTGKGLPEKSFLVVLDSTD
jgi:hypothetical protein